MALPYDEIHLIADPLYGYLRITVPRDENPCRPRHFRPGPCGETPDRR